MNIDRTIDITEKEETLVLEKFSQLKTERQKYIARWKDIQNFVAITNEVNSEFEDNENKNKQKDVFINDPTGFICTNQAGDYLAGILWGLNAITLEPSEYLKQIAKGADFSEFFKKATKITLDQMNSTDAGLNSILKSYAYEQFSYGTSGIGTFKNKGFEEQQTDCCLTYKPYGVYNSCIDEGANSKINVIYTVYNWTLNKIIEEFCLVDGEFNEENFKALPDDFKNAYSAGRLNTKFKIVYGIMPNNFYRMSKRGKAGAKFKGYWFIESSKTIFKVDYFKEMPVAVCRFIRANNQIYGESSGSLAISSIKLLNHLKGDTIDNIEKITDAPLGVISGALVAGNVINRSAGSVTVFNPQASNSGQSPIFPISQAGDISAVVNFLLPELKKDITNIFKIDQLLDFNTATQMTATESSYRMSIRGKSINGILSQQKAECIEPLVFRSISIIQDCGLYGKDLNKMPEMTEEQITEKQRVFEANEFIPQEIVKCIDDGKRWYNVKFNGELERLCNAEIYEAFGRFLQYLQAILQIKPELVNALNDYDTISLIQEVSNLANNKLIKSKTQYNEIIKQIQEAQQAQAEAQQQLVQAQYLGQIANADKQSADAEEKRNGVNPYEL